MTVLIPTGKSNLDISRQEHLGCHIAYRILQDETLLNKNELIILDHLGNNAIELIHPPPPHLFLWYEHAFLTAFSFWWHCSNLCFVLYRHIWKWTFSFLYIAVWWKCHSLWGVLGIYTASWTRLVSCWSCTWQKMRKGLVFSEEAGNIEVDQVDISTNLDFKELHGKLPFNNNLHDDE